MEKIVTAMLLMLVKAWTTVDTIGSDFKPNVDDYDATFEPLVSLELCQLFRGICATQFG